MEENPWEIASQLDEIVDGVRASHRRIVVAVAPEERHHYALSEELYQEIMQVIDGTMYQHEYVNGDRETVEQHKWGAGRSNPLLQSSEQPAGYELQMSFVK